MVAPVRETCAQTLGVALRHMNESGVFMTVNVLLKLLREDQWEVRHGGLLGIKYALAVRQVPSNTKRLFSAVCSEPAGTDLCVFNEMKRTMEAFFWFDLRPFSFSLKRT